MSFDKLMEEVYGHICLPKPREILCFPTIEEAFSDHINWSRRVENVMTCFWSYQFPMATPSSYWGACHLKKDKFRLDVKRTPNKNGCFVYGEHIYENPDSILTQDQYDDICLELDRQTFDQTVDNLVENILEKYEAEVDLFDEHKHKEDPTCQMSVDDYIFLANFEWLQEELWFLNRSKDQYGVSINEHMLETLKEVQESGNIFITFSNLVVVAGLT